mgnify:CR=1 FL=1
MTTHKERAFKLADEIDALHSKLEEHVDDLRLEWADDKFDDEYPIWDSEDAQYHLEKAVDLIKRYYTNESLFRLAEPLKRQA